MTPIQLEILQHALGLDQYGQGEAYRNFFCAGDDDEPICRELIALGYMKQHRTTELYPYFNCSVSEAGREAVHRESPKPPKLTRAQQRYRRFLNARDAFGDLTFREFLKMEAERRNEHA